MTAQTFPIKALRGRQINGTEMELLATFLIDTSNGEVARAQADFALRGYTDMVIDTTGTVTFGPPAGVPFTSFPPTPDAE